jgi:tetratricopeptide (TPR) repeat protein
MRTFSLVVVTCLILLGSAMPLHVAAQSADLERAHAALQGGDVDARRNAIVQLAKAGAMADAPALHRALRDDDEMVRAMAEQALWLIWSRSNDPRVDALFADGLELMNNGQLKNAIDVFSKIIAAKPDFAEGWNKRATLYYLVGDLQRSLADCDEVIKRNPQHFGALSGYGQIYVQMGELDKALEYFRRALEANPNMQGVRVNIDGIERLLKEKARRST